MAYSLASDIARTSPAEDVLVRLSGLITSGKLAAGSRLPSERQLAEQMQVSRVVIREVAKKLEQQGLVRIEHGIGVTVINNRCWPLQQTIHRLLPKAKHRLRHCARARLLVEPELAAAAAGRATGANVRRLSLIQARMLQEKDVPAAALLDIAFHDMIAAMAGNKVISLMLSSIAELGRLSREHTLLKFGVGRACGYHARILAAIAAHEPEAARGAMRRHLIAALGDLS